MRVLAQALKKAAQRAGDLVARYGGEEFVILLPGTSAHSALATARRIQSEICLLAQSHPENPAGIVTVSLGVASLVPSKGDTPEELIRQADLALYRAKQSGRNCLHLATT